MNITKVITMSVFLSILSSKIVLAATADSFVFTAVGDYGNSYSTDTSAASQTNFTKVIRGIGKQQPDFHLGLGDYTYNDTVSNAAKWCDSVRKNLNIGAGKAENDTWGLNFPFEIVAGNHDIGESNADIITVTNALRECLPHKINNITESPTVKRGGSPATSYAIEYYFDYPSTINPVARIILGSPGLKYKNGGEISYTKGSTNYNFIKDAIIDARAKNIPWVIVGKHKNCITNGTKSCEYSKDFMDMMAGKDLGANGDYGMPVDIVLEGHEHTYHRSKQLRTNATTCTTIQTGGYNANCVSNPGPYNFKKGEGKILSIIGTGGMALRSISGSSDSEAGYFTSWTSANQAYTGGVANNGTNSWGFTKFNVTRTSLTAQFISTTGTYSDNFTISSTGITPNPTVVATPTPTKIPTPSTTPTKVPTPTPTGTNRLDLNGDGKIDLGDVMMLVQFIFS